MSKQTPLPTSVIFGALASPWSSIDQPRRTIGRCAADGVDDRGSSLQQIIADNHAEGCAVAMRPEVLSRFAARSVRPMSLAGRVDQVAGEEDALQRDAAQVIAHRCPPAAVALHVACRCPCDTRVN